jgi:hypothetical protein
LHFKNNIQKRKAGANKSLHQLFFFLGVTGLPGFTQIRDKKKPGEKDKIIK